MDLVLTDTEASNVLVIKDIFFATMAQFFARFAENFSHARLRI
jgi:hypothetical protein